MLVQVLMTTMSIIDKLSSFHHHYIHKYTLPISHVRKHPQLLRTCRPYRSAPYPITQLLEPPESCQRLSN